MEKTWEDFWSSGKITDYLSYRNGVVDGAGMQMEQKNLKPKFPNLLKIR